ncbi:MAG: hypothetical protein A2381_13275 [Bdellovibrionales bacterium RIFOXYB1_FULL_37_110]|nr:MAG: hypothetical protein A2181_02600 [Bdellovibrionales bacterium RIFOXYA1_FULL_38_20]OFZ51674.1 MAG: hypothetical protein A2417_12935 [Bdellovibrionales bacterium RIFOXYC1_FULL_37_79]OFZ60501.1 MAG: hypothetical protein A2381_13275 [Bdellovibrionales bacterium RIFOXYB1_FULL_37_110]OFZ65075.1 MAG: hypothetical protein A2577_09540 [Bdellovibrionales bacterium RIFOXYD1_FULL_36_51]
MKKIIFILLFLVYSGSSFSEIDQVGSVIKTLNSINSGSTCTDCPDNTMEGNNKEHSEFAQSSLTISGERVLYCQISKSAGCFLKSNENQRIGTNCSCVNPNTDTPKEKKIENGKLENPPSITKKIINYCKINESFGCFLPETEIKPKGEKCFCVDQQKGGPVAGINVPQIKPVSAGYFRQIE